MAHHHQQHQAEANAMEHAPNHAHGSVFSFSLGPHPILFSGLQAGPDIFSFLFACLAIVGLGVARQELVRLADQQKEGAAIATVELRTAFFFLQALLSYLLMLIAMTFNAYLFLAVLAGLTLGHYRMLKINLLAAKSGISGKHQQQQQQQEECCA